MTDAWRTIAINLADQLSLYDRSSHVHQATTARFGYKRKEVLEAFFEALREESE